MIGRKKWLGRTSWRCASVALVASLALSGGVTGQDHHPDNISTPVPHLSTALGVQLKAQSFPTYHSDPDNPPGTSASSNVPYSEAAVTPEGARLITLQEAQQKAAHADNNPLVRLGQLQVEVAKQARLSTKSSFFPEVGASFENFHFNKFMGQLLQINRPILGTTTTAGLPLLGKNQTLLAVTATEPITPLFQIRQLYKIGLADERIARAKAGMPVSETANKVEKNYYELLVAKRQLAFVKAKAAETENKWLLASSSAMPLASATHDEELMETSNALAIATTKVKELTASLNDMLGWPSDTELELVPPDPGFEEISLKEATDKALAANPEVVEAEQNLVKARAASTIQKLTYVPTVAATGGYAYNNNAIPLLPRDFSFIGMVATYNLFDFGKREHTIKGAKAQAEMAELAVQLTKAKVAASVKNSHLELERLRQLSELTRRLASAIQVQKASYEENSAVNSAAKKAKVEAEMFQADLDYRQALARLKTLMGEL
jgi:outer membrane protein TolC